MLPANFAKGINLCEPKSLIPDCKMKCFCTT